MPAPALLMAAPAIAQSVGGLFQTLFSGRKKAQREMEAQLNNSPAYTPNKGIADYYQESLNRYNENPQQSAIYQNAVRNAQRSTAQGISTLQDRRSALAGVGRLAAIQNDAMNNATAQAESRRDMRFGQLGQATGMKAGEERRAFDINVLTPYQRRLQMAEMKASAANARNDAGLQNLFGGLSNVSKALMPMGAKTDVALPETQTQSMPRMLEETVSSRPTSPLSSFGSQVSVNSFKPMSIFQRQANPATWNKFNNAFMPKTFNNY